MGVADVMHAAGLTHGGFYAHFASKAELLAEAIEQAGVQSAELLQVLAGGPTGTVADRSALIDAYLSTVHLSAVGFGCPMAALAAESARQGESVRQALAHRIIVLADLLAASDPTSDRQHAAQGRARALATVATMVGAMALARAVEPSALAQDILDAARKLLLNPSH